jgi:cytochrome b involved in lipid metabolism
MKESTACGGTSPAAAVRAAERSTTIMGHHNAGPLSSRYGFLPPPGFTEPLPVSHAHWDQLAADLPQLQRGLTLRWALDRLPLLPADPRHLPDRSLQRSATILGLLAHAYFHLLPSRPQSPPAAITVPWEQVCRRLGRPGPSLTYVDLIISNWRQRDSTAADPMRVSNLRLLIPTVDNEEEHIFYLTQTEILAQTAGIVAAAGQAGDAIQVDDTDKVFEALSVIVTCLHDITRTSLATINPRPSSRSYVDPVVWARTVAPFAVPIVPGVLGPSGTASPLFNLLDSLFQRPSIDSRFGQEIRRHRDAYPPNWRRFLTAVDTIELRTSIERRGTPALRDVFNDALDAYAGQHGFLSRHRRKVFGYLEIAFKVGRDLTIGGFSGTPQDRTWIQVDAALQTSQQERGSTDHSRTSPTVIAPQTTERTVPLSELLLHNDDEHGYWLCVDDGIYDVTELIHHHPGGPLTLQSYAGRDATDAYHRLHHTSTAAPVLLGRCRIGSRATPDLRWLTTQSNSDARVTERLFNTWATQAAAAAEMQNSLRHDYQLQRGIGPGREPERRTSPYLLERRIDTYRRFLAHYLRPTTGAIAQILWPATLAAFPGDNSPDQMQRRVDYLWTSPAGAAALALPDRLQRRVTDAAQNGDQPRSPDLDTIDAVCRRLQIHSTRFLIDLKMLLRAGIVQLEHGLETTTVHGGHLVTLAKTIPDLLLNHLTQAAGADATPTAGPVPSRTW